MFKIILYLSLQLAIVPQVFAIDILEKNGFVGCTIHGDIDLSKVNIKEIPTPTGYEKEIELTKRVFEDIKKSFDLLIDSEEVKVSFGIYDDSTGKNAFARKIKENHYEIRVGINLLKQLIKNQKLALKSVFSEPEAYMFEVIAVLAHELAHIAQFHHGVIAQGKHMELMADAIAGATIGSTFSGIKKPNQVDFFPAISKTIFEFYRRGDTNFHSINHHGTPDERLNAFFWGFVLGYQLILVEDSIFEMTKKNYFTPGNTDNKAQCKPIKHKNLTCFDVEYDDYINDIEGTEALDIYLEFIDEETGEFYKSDPGDDEVINLKQLTLENNKFSYKFEGKPSVNFNIPSLSVNKGGHKSSGLDIETYSLKTAACVNSNLQTIFTKYIRNPNSKGTKYWKLFDLSREERIYISTMGSPTSFVPEEACKPNEPCQGTFESISFLDIFNPENESGTQICFDTKAVLEKVKAKIETRKN